MAKNITHCPKGLNSVHSFGMVGQYQGGLTSGGRSFRSIRLELRSIRMELRDSHGAQETIGGSQSRDQLDRGHLGASED